MNDVAVSLGAPAATVLLDNRAKNTLRELRRRAAVSPAVAAHLDGLRKRHTGRYSS